MRPIIKALNRAARAIEEFEFLISRVCEEKDHNLEAFIAELRELADELEYEENKTRERQSKVK